MDLFSYCIPYDDGAAPNPYWGVCTLVICKPAVRRKAKKGDWIVGTGAKYARLANGVSKDMSGRVVYAMKVTDKMTMRDYDAFTQAKLREKVPVRRSKDTRRRLGDAIYEFSTTPPTQRQGVHDTGNIRTDLGGKHALLSTHFYYFGDQAVSLPRHLRPIAQNRQGHRRGLNAPFVADFVAWIDGLGPKPGTLAGTPLLDLYANDTASRWCASGRAEDDEDEREDPEPGC